MPESSTTNSEVHGPIVGIAEKFLLSAEEAALLLSVHRSTVYDLLGRGDLASVRIGRRRLIPRSALTEFIAQHQRTGLA